jgi:hypothetical protein
MWLIGIWVTTGCIRTGRPTICLTDSAPKCFSRRRAATCSRWLACRWRRPPGAAVRSAIRHCDGLACGAAQGNRTVAGPAPVIHLMKTADLSVDNCCYPRSRTFEGHDRPRRRGFVTQLGFWRASAVDQSAYKRAAPEVPSPTAGSAAARAPDTLRLSWISSDTLTSSRTALRRPVHD